MTLRERYRRLSFWNKIAFWGSVSSIVGIALVLLPLFISHSPEAPSTEPVCTPAIAVRNSLTSDGNLLVGDTDLVVKNEGNCDVTDVKLHPVVYSFGRNLKMRSRSAPDHPTSTCRELLAGQTIHVHKADYYDEARFVSMKSPDPDGPNPLMLVVLSYRRKADNKLFHKLEPFLITFDGPVFALRWVGQKLNNGSLGFYVPMIREIEDYERTFYVEE